jgi:Protein of unknown function (DUF1569)
VAERRLLSLASLEEILPEVRRLQKGHETVGQWSLAQICNHLAMAFSVVAAGPRVVESASATQEERDRHAGIRQRFFALERFPDGRDSPPPLVPGDGLDEHHEAEELASALARFSAAGGPFPAHPRIGPLSRDEWVWFHRMHAAHHLGFVVPR